MTMEDFLELSESPKIKEKELQHQLDLKVGKTKVTKKWIFSFQILHLLIQIKILLSIQSLKSNKRMQREMNLV